MEDRTVIECPECGNGHWAAIMRSSIVLMCSRCRWCTANGVEGDWTRQKDMVFADYSSGQVWMPTEEEALKFY